MRQALTEALIDFEGALVVVSHDRHLIRSTTDDLYLVHDKRSNRSTATGGLSAVAERRAEAGKPGRRRTEGKQRQQRSVTQRSEASRSRATHSNAAAA